MPTDEFNFPSSTSFLEKQPDAVNKRIPVAKGQAEFGAKGIFQIFEE